MVKEIVKDPELLQTPAEPATAEDAAIAQDLVDTMESMRDHCACLAANQIGANKAVIVYDNGAKVGVMYNPRVKQAIVPYQATEACLSLPYESEVKRFRRIIVAFDELVDGQLVPRQRKFSDWKAEIIQHAIDHCQGKLV